MISELVCKIVSTRQEIRNLLSSQNNDILLLGEEESGHVQAGEAEKNAGGGKQHTGKHRPTLDRRPSEGTRDRNSSI